MTMQRIDNASATIACPCGRDSRYPHYQRRCDYCGTDYCAQKVTSRYCRDRCRADARKDRERGVCMACGQRYRADSKSAGTPQPPPRR